MMKDEGVVGEREEMGGGRRRSFGIGGKVGLVVKLRVLNIALIGHCTLSRPRPQTQGVSKTAQHRKADD